MYGTASVVNGAAAMAFLPRLVEGHFLQRAHALSATGALVMITAGSGLADWPSVVVLAAGELLYGLAMGMSNSHEMSYRQLVTPDHLQARTNTSMRSLNRAVMVVVAAGLAATPFRTVRAPS